MIIKNEIQIITLFALDAYEKGIKRKGIKEDINIGMLFLEQSKKESIGLILENEEAYKFNQDVVNLYIRALRYWEKRSGIYWRKQCEKSIIYYENLCQTKIK